MAATRQRSRCDCGRVKSRYSNTCTKCHREQMADVHGEAVAIVSSGECPRCGSGLVRNLSMAGWWQCEQYGVVGFRKDAERDACGFQCFTE